VIPLTRTVPVDATPSSDRGPESSAAITNPQVAQEANLSSSLPGHLTTLFSMHVIEGHFKKLSDRLSDSGGDRVRRRRCAEIISQDLWENEY